MTTPKAERTLHVFQNGIDWCVAYDSADALAVWCEYTGEAPEDYSGGAYEYAELPDDAIVTIARVTDTARKWVVINGRGFLGSTEC